MYLKFISNQSKQLKSHNALKTLNSGSAREARASARRGEYKPTFQLRLFQVQSRSKSFSNQQQAPKGTQRHLRFNSKVKNSENDMLSGQARYGEQGCSLWRATTCNSRGEGNGSRGERWTSSLARRGSQLAMASDELWLGQNVVFTQFSSTNKVLSLISIPEFILNIF